PPLAAQELDLEIVIGEQEAELIEITVAKLLEDLGLDLSIDLGGELICAAAHGPKASPKLRSPSISAARRCGSAAASARRPRATAGAWRARLGRRRQGRWRPGPRGRPRSRPRFRPRRSSAAAPRCS